MSKAIELKSAVVAEIAEKLEKAASVIVVDYKGLTVEQVTDLRSQMREAGVDYKVYKNTLVRRAASQIEGEAFANFNDELLVGPNAIAFGYKDAVARGDWYIDVHSANKSLVHQISYQPGDYYEIPYRAMITNEVENLVVAGRCISTTFLMQASVRIIPTCIDMGEAAGMATVLANQSGTPLNALDGKDIAEKLGEYR